MATPLRTDVQQELFEREQRGLRIAATCKLTKNGGIWLVPSQSGHGRYTVSPDPEAPHCTCPDHETRGLKCKHIFVVEFALKREEHNDGSTTITQTVTVTETIKKPTYPQDWPAYNAAQTNEKDKFLSLLYDLCAGIPEPPNTHRSIPPIRASRYNMAIPTIKGYLSKFMLPSSRDGAKQTHPCA